MEDLCIPSVLLIFREFTGVVSFPSPTVFPVVPTRQWACILVWKTVEQSVNYILRIFITLKK